MVIPVAIMMATEGSMGGQVPVGSVRMSAYGSYSHHTGSSEDLSVLSSSQNAPPRSTSSGHLATGTHLHP